MPPVMIVDVAIGPLCSDEEKLEDVLQSADVPVEREV